MDDVGETLSGQDDGVLEMETMQRPFEMSIPMAMISRPSVSLDVRRMNNKGVLRDDPTTFGLSWKSGEHVLVISNRQAVKLSYVAEGKEVSQDILLAWNNDQSWFVCLCERQVTKLHFDGSRFHCRRCQQGPPKAKRRRIPAKQRLRILARAGFRCVGCYEQDGLTVASPIPPLPGNFFFDYDYHDDELIAVCSFCRISPNASVRRVIEVAGRLRSLESVETSECAPFSTDALRLNNIQIAEMQLRCESDTNSATYTDITVHRQHKERRKERRKQTHRVHIRLLLGHRPSEIARDEGVSRQTVWRQRKRLNKMVVPVARDLMRGAAKRKDWEEARWWWETLSRVGADIEGEDKVTGKEAEHVRKLLEAVRDELLGRALREEAA